MGRVGSSNENLNSDEDDPQLGAWVEQHLEVVRKKRWRVPTVTSLLFHPI